MEAPNATSESMTVDAPQQQMPEGNDSSPRAQAKRSQGAQAEQQKDQMVLDESVAPDMAVAKRDAPESKWAERGADLGEQLSGAGAGGDAVVPTKMPSRASGEGQDDPADVFGAFSIEEADLQSRVFVVKQDESVKTAEFYVVQSAQEWMNVLTAEGREINMKDLQPTFGPADWRGPGTQHRRWQKTRPLRPDASLVEWRQHHGLHGWTPYHWVMPVLKGDHWGARGNPRMIIQSNRTLVPPVPPLRPNQDLFYDAHYGEGEEVWLPQWFDGNWYKGFIDMMRASSRGGTDSFYWRTHQDATADIAWYRINWAHFVPVGPAIWSLGGELRLRVREALMHLRWNWWQVHDYRTRGAWSRCKQRLLLPEKSKSDDFEERRRIEGLAPHARSEQEALFRENQEKRKKEEDECAALETCMPMQAVNEIDTLAVLLCDGSGTSWELRDALAQFQRCVLHMRGWMHFVACLGRNSWPEVDNLEVSPDMDAALRRYGNRHCRGVFTKDKRVAHWYAQYGIPVWLVQDWSPHLERVLKSHVPRARAHFEFYGSGMLDAFETQTQESRRQRPPQRYSALARSSASLWGLLDTQIEELEKVKQQLEKDSVPVRPLPRRPNVEDLPAQEPLPGEAMMEDAREEEEQEEDARMYDDDGDYPLDLQDGHHVRFTNNLGSRPDMQIHGPFDLWKLHGNAAQAEVRSTGSSAAPSSSTMKGILKTGVKLAGSTSAPAPSSKATSSSQPQLLSEPARSDASTSSKPQPAAITSASTPSAASSSAGTSSLKRDHAARIAEDDESLSTRGEEGPSPKKKRRKKSKRTGTANKEAFRPVASQYVRPMDDDEDPNDARKRGNQLIKNMDVSNTSPQRYTSLALPPWYPEALPVASKAAKRIDGSPKRQLERGLDPDFAVPQAIIKAADSLRVPRAAYFANTWSEGGTREELSAERAREGDLRVSHALYMLVQAWPYIKRRVEGTQLHETVGVTTSDMRHFWRRRVDYNVDKVLAQMGLDVVLDGTDDEDHGGADGINVPYQRTPSKDDLLRWPHEDDAGTCKTTEAAFFSNTLFGIHANLQDDDDSDARCEMSRTAAWPADWDERKKTHVRLVSRVIVHERDEGSYRAHDDMRLRPLGDDEEGVTGWVRWHDYVNMRIVWLPPESTEMARLGGERTLRVALQLEQEAEGEWTLSEQSPTLRLWPGLWEQALWMYGKPSSPPAPNATRATQPQSSPSWTALLTPTSESALMEPKTEEQKKQEEKEKFPKILLKLGQSATWNGQQLPAWYPDMREWAPIEWRRFLIWSVSELEFRHELLAFDVLIRQLHGYKITTYLAQTTEVRYGMITRCWGGGGVVPTHEESALCSPDWTTRWRALSAFCAIMRAWPKSTRLLPNWFNANDDAVDPPPHSEQLEAEVWTCYAQIYFDYRRKLPPLPFLRPALPFEM